jgi:molecular chaperone Hsp33
MKKDKLTRIICEDLNLRAYTAQTLNTVRTITGLHNTSPNATAALGRTITATVLLSATLKPDSHQNITVRFSGSGPIHEIHVQADAMGHVRGYVENPDVDLTEDIGKISFSRTIGAGFLTVSKDLEMKEPYKSVIPLQKGEVAADIAYYLTSSEQIPSALLIALNIEPDSSISVSGGILIQTFPETPDNVIERIEHNIMNSEETLTDHMNGGKDIVSYLSRLFDNHALTVLSEHAVRHSCRCSRRLILSTLQYISNEQLLDMIEKDRGAEIICSFCKKKYIYSEDDLRKMLTQKSQ